MRAVNISRFLFLVLIEFLCFLAEQNSKFCELSVKHNSLQSVNKFTLVVCSSSRLLAQSYEFCTQRAETHLAGATQREPPLNLPKGRLYVPSLGAERLNVSLLATA